MGEEEVAEEEELKHRVANASLSLSLSRVANAPLTSSTITTYLVVSGHICSSMRRWREV